MQPSPPVSGDHKAVGAGDPPEAVTPAGGGFPILFGPLAADTLARYYAHRAEEFEEAYAIPERRADLARLAQMLRGLVAGHSVLEVACGSGYWTRVMSATAASITATDINEPMLALARRKRCGPARVEFRQADAWRLGGVAGKFTAAAALFWWSHLPRSGIRPFLTGLHRCLAAGARVVFADHLRADCRWAPPVGVDEEGNTYQRRVLHTGEVFDILKNYPAEAEVRAAVAPVAVEVQYTALASVWLLTYRTPLPDSLR